MCCVYKYCKRVWFISFHFIFCLVVELEKKIPVEKKHQLMCVCLRVCVCVRVIFFFVQKKNNSIMMIINRSNFKWIILLFIFLWISSIHCSIISDQQRSSDEDFNEESNVDDDDDDSDHLYSTINCKVNEKQNKKNFHYYSPFDYSNSFYCFSINRWINKFRLVINTIM